MDFCKKGQIQSRFDWISSKFSNELNNFLYIPIIFKFNVDARFGLGHNSHLKSQVDIQLALF